MTMNPVAAPSILLSTNKANLERFIKTGEVEADKGSSIFSPTNTNFLSLEHTMELAGKGGGLSHFSIKLKIQDPDDSFMKAFVHSDVLSVIKGELTEGRQVDFFIMYGLGNNKSRHWAGPFICNVLEFRNYSTGEGSDIVEMTLMALLPLQANLSLQPRSDIIHPLVKSFTTTRSLGAGATGTLTASPFSVLLGGGISVDSSPVDLGVLSFKGGEWNISPDQLVEAIRKLYTNYANIWGTPNFICYLTKEFRDLISQLLDATVALFGVDFIKQAKSIQDIDIFLAPFGLTVTYKRLPPDPVKTSAPLASRSSLPGATGAGSLALGRPAWMAQPKHTIFLDMTKESRENIDFLLIFKKFYSELGRRIGKPITVDAYVENNPTIVKYMKGRGSSTAITDVDQPVVIVGELNLIKDELRNFGNVKLIVKPLDPDGAPGKAFAKESIHQYYVNKLLGRFASHYFTDLDEVNDFDLDEMETRGPDDIPLKFEAHTANSNITSYNFDANLFTFAAIRRKLGKIDATHDEIQKHILNTLGQLAENSENFDLSGVAESLTKEILANSKNPKGTGFTYKVPNSKNWKPIISNFLNYFYTVAVKSGITGTVRTFPYFQLSDQFMLGSQCQVKIKEAPSVLPLAVHEGKLLNPKNFGEKDTFYNGIYTITGFKHVISERDVFSEFKIMKVALPSLVNAEGAGDDFTMKAI